MSKLYFRYGAMNCGKSTALIQVAHNYEERGMKVVIIKPKIDTKGEDSIISRIGAVRKADILAGEDFEIFNTIKTKLEGENKIHCILVDEVQFMKSWQIDDLLKVAVLLNIPVICYGLRTDFAMKGFEGSTRLLLVAHSIEELKNICRCGKKATLNGRKVNNKFTFEGEQVVIDDNNNVSYEALCTECYFRLKNN